MHLQTFVLRTAATLLVAGGIAACTTPGPGPQQPVPGPSATPQPPRQALFIRPAAGTTVGRFDGVRNKGLDIAGNLGDPIVASADGRVVYVGGELRSYGNMVIVKHNETFLTAYAHARTILVKEGTVVRQGQKIAEMGNSESDRVKLHFEIRKNGTAVDPEPYLNGRLQQ
ncbi:peptidoglycan DD-metalloendopeptidase family protein [Variovorax paradoxus]|uniref:Peptidoglycan DD-metalloendopeptidase family protein n=1 Tax=Variovorax paradoxus TaxID=34073 RepID=A0A5Q0M5X3_VARPD|nr:peptidoglycan DD-metalloendopeptidase family protein [Variovorax paradoxus]QFZ84933.1 peptidoglycan DD-metalloendopeptidase family protein [Variovorax paradoxus]